MMPRGAVRRLIAVVFFSLGFHESKGNNMVWQSIQHGLANNSTIQLKIHPKQRVNMEDLLYIYHIFIDRLVTEAQFQ